MDQECKNWDKKEILAAVKHAWLYSELVQALMGRTPVGPCSHQQGSQLPPLQVGGKGMTQSFFTRKKETATTLRSES